jgi:hypothetical protein
MSVDRAGRKAENPPGLPSGLPLLHPVEDLKLPGGEGPVAVEISGARTLRG